MSFTTPALSSRRDATRPRAPIAVVSSVFAFVVLFYAAACAYPGGTHVDHAAVGHDFWRNTLCDVTRSVALDGRLNGAGSTLARVAMTILAGGLGVFFVLLPRLFPARVHAGAAVRALGGLAALGGVAVVLLPSDRFPATHGVAVVCAGIPGLTASLVALHALARERGSLNAVVVLGGLALAVAGVDFGLYVSELVRGGASQLAVAVLERVATAFLLAWMLAVAHKARSPS